MALHLTTDSRAQLPERRTRQKTQQKTQENHARAEGNLRIAKDRRDKHVHEVLDKEPHLDSERKKLPPLVQCASYAVNTLSAVPGRAHAIGLAVCGACVRVTPTCTHQPPASLDEAIYIWWYDRHGAIQCDGINLLRDLPRFVLLLMAIPRLQLSDWGFLDIDAVGRGMHERTSYTRKVPSIINFPNNVQAQCVFHRDDVLYNRYCLTGRATSVVKAEVRGDQVQQGREYVLKLSWVTRLAWRRISW